MEAIANVKTVLPVCAAADVAAVLVLADLPHPREAGEAPLLSHCFERPCSWVP